MFSAAALVAVEEDTTVPFLMWSTLVLFDAVKKSSVLSDTVSLSTFGVELHHCLVFDPGCVEGSRRGPHS